MKKVKGTLVGQNSNAFFLVGYFREQARKQGWTKEEIKKVTDDAMSGDYNHLLVTLSNHMED